MYDKCALQSQMSSCVLRHYDWDLIFDSSDKSDNYMCASIVKLYSKLIFF
jgi:hypothetical protein